MSEENDNPDIIPEQIFLLFIGGEGPVKINK